ncbi:MAG: hypothetical protein EP329_21970 [Deltaproteobacteria bacterium]|nr:MAG: hypothetical protein EP329_21970 [Deltaproteobacteria bacterium]
MKKLIIASLLGVGALAGCADDPTTVIELTVTETIPVNFGEMTGGVEESAAVALASLLDEPAYAENVAALRCAGLDLAASGITVTQLDVAAGATVLSYTVEVAPVGSASWAVLGSFNGSIIAGQTVPMDGAGFTVDATGLAVLSETLLSESPELAVQVRAQVPGDIAGLQVALKLAQDFSSDASACPGG